VRSARKGPAWLWVLIPFVCAGLMVFSMLMGERNTATASDGISAPAMVERAGRGACVVGFKGSDCFALTLRIHAAHRAPFTKKIDVNVPSRWASRVQPLSWVMVVIDRNDPEKVSLNIDAFELPSPTPPATASASSPAP
jgi:hypothetical protein